MTPEINIFTYGSLMCHDIMEKVAGSKAKSGQGTLHDFFRSAIHGEEYPGIIAREGSEVQGIIYFNISQAALDRLDMFEGTMYERREVSVRLDNAFKNRAFAYIVRDEYQHLLTGSEWSFERFLAHGKARFEQAYVGFNTV